MTAKFAELEEEQPVAEGEQPANEYHPKAHLVLKGSVEYDWGVVMDCKGCINYIPEDAEVVGTWSKYGEGTYWVNLQTPLKALEDRATQLFVELAESRERETEKFALAPSVKKRRARKEPKEKEPELTAVFSSLRAGLKAGKD